MSICDDLVVLAINLFLGDLVSTEPIQKIAGFIVASDRCKIARTIW